MRRFFLALILLLSLPTAALPLEINAQSSIDNDTSLEFNEIQQLLKTPQPRIKIPGLQLTPVSELNLEEQGTDTFLNIPHIGEYIAAVYRYGIVVISIVAVATIIIAGAQWMLPGNIAIIGEGDQQQRINKAKKVIINSLIALLLATGSYALLYNINPNLVEFRSLRVLLVRRHELFLEETQSEVDESFAPATVQTKPTWNANTFDCNKRETYPPAGVAPKNALITYTCSRGMFGSVTSIREMKEPLCQVAARLERQGYGLGITSSHRGFDRQVDLWCNEGARRYPDLNNRKKFYAPPGYSNHGHGVAVDAYLTDREGKRLYGEVNSRTQCDISPEFIRTLAKAFYDTDQKFNRLSTEVWHFEYDTGGKKSSVGKFEVKPTVCPSR